MLEDLKNKKILILGFEKEGKVTLSFLRKLFPEKTLGVADQNKDKKTKERKIRWHLGKNYLKAIKDYELIIKSPGIPIHSPEIEKIYKKNKNQKITSQTEIFFNNCPGKIIGITGTKGKGTVASLIYKILKKGGIKAHLIGNIGKPVLSFLFSATPKDVYVYEISSHQLYNLKKSPLIAVLLSIYPDHLDFFKNFKEYIKAKANISCYQKKNNYLIYYSKNKFTAEIAQKSKAKKIAFDRKRYNFLKSRNKIPLLGKINLNNIKAAIVVGELFSIPKEKIIEAIKDFKPLPHRLEYLGNYKGIKFYNDSIATIPEATIVALDVLGNKLESIFLGGSNKNLNFKDLAKRILKSKIKNLILFPPTGKEILEEIFKLKKSSQLRYFFVENMKKGVELAYQYTQKGKICLLSPASASFGLFKDYQERGRLFKKWIFRLNSKL